MSDGYPTMDEPWYPFYDILIATGEEEKEDRNYENALIVACAVGSYLIEHPPPSSFDRSKYKSAVPSIDISSLSQQQIYAGLMTPIARSDLSRGPVIRINTPYKKNKTNTDKVLSDIYYALTNLMPGIDIVKASESYEGKASYLRFNIDGTNRKKGNVKLLENAKGRCSTLGGALNFEKQELYGTPGAFKLWDPLSRIKDIANKISTKAVSAPTKASNSASSALGSKPEESTSSAAASSSETKESTSSAAASSSETKESTSSVAASSSKPEESTSSGASNSSSSTLSSSTASSSNPVRTTRAFNSTASDLEVPESLKEGDYNIIDISNDGWCLYNTYLTPFSLAGSENARKLACIVADRFSKMPDFDKQFDDYGRDVVEPGEKPIKGFPSQEIVENDSEPYITVGETHRKVIAKTNFIESITKLRNPGKINDGPVLWPDDFWFVILSTLFTNISIIIYVRDKDTNQLNIDRRYATVKDPKDTKDPPNFNIFIQSNGNHFNIIEPSGGQLERFVNLSGLSWALRQSILDNTFRDSTCGSKDKGDDDFIRRRSVINVSPPGSFITASSSAYKAEGKEEYRSSTTGEESKESKEGETLTVVPSMDSLGQIGDALTEIEMIMKEFLSIITVLTRKDDARLQYNAINVFLLPNIIMRIGAIVTDDNKTEILGFQNRLQEIYKSLNAFSSVLPDVEGGVRPPIIPVFVAPEAVRRVRPLQQLSFLVPEEGVGGGNSSASGRQNISSEALPGGVKVTPTLEEIEQKISDLDEAKNELITDIENSSAERDNIQYDLNIQYNVISILLLPSIIEKIQAIRISNDSIDIQALRNRLQEIYKILISNESILAAFPTDILGIVHLPVIPDFINPSTVDSATAMEAKLANIDDIITAIEEMRKTLTAVLVEAASEAGGSAKAPANTKIKLIYTSINQYFLPRVFDLIKAIPVTAENGEIIHERQTRLETIHASLRLDQTGIEAAFSEGRFTPLIDIPDFVNILPFDLEKIDERISQIEGMRSRLNDLITLDPESNVLHATELYNYINGKLLPSVITAMQGIDVTDVSDEIRQRIIGLQIRLETLYNSLKVDGVLDNATVAAAFPSEMDGLIRPPPFEPFVELTEEDALILDESRREDVDLADVDLADVDLADLNRRELGGLRGDVALHEEERGEGGTGGGTGGRAGGGAGGLAPPGGGAGGLAPPGRGPPPGRRAPSVLDPLARLLAAPLPAYFTRADANTARFIAANVRELANAAGTGYIASARRADPPLIVIDPGDEEHF